MADPLVDVRNLGVRLVTGQRETSLVDDVSFTVARGEVLCIVGESGCGKTITARSIMGLNRNDRRFSLSGQILFQGRDLMALSDAEMRGIRGTGIGMIFQDPMTSLNPLHRIGRQIGEGMRLHMKLSEAEIRERTLSLLAQVGIPTRARASTTIRTSSRAACASAP